MYINIQSTSLGEAIQITYSRMLIIRFMQSKLDQHRIVLGFGRNMPDLPDLTQVIFHFGMVVLLYLQRILIV